MTRRKKKLHFSFIIPATHQFDNTEMLYNNKIIKTNDNHIKEEEDRHYNIIQEGIMKEDRGRLRRFDNDCFPRRRFIWE
ncbi:MAG: hypothetical protein ACOC6P_01615 [Candidatus Aminicenantaceae bacterium]